MIDPSLEQEKVRFECSTTSHTNMYKQSYIFIMKQMYNTRSQELEAMLQFKIPQGSPQT